MIWFDKSFIKFCRSFINLIKLLTTKTCSSARVRLCTSGLQPYTAAGGKLVAYC